MLGVQVLDAAQLIVDLVGTDRRVEKVVDQRLRRDRADHVGRRELAAVPQLDPAGLTTVGDDLPDRGPG
jgi:hypothetical protein